MKKATSIRLGFSGLVALVVLAAATVAAAAPPAQGERQFAARADRPALQLPSAVKRALRPGRLAAASRAVARSARGGVSAAGLEPGEHPGFAYCGNDNLVYAWPAYAPTHDYTLTRSYFVFSESGDFSDAVVTPGTYHVVQIGADPEGADYYYYDSTVPEIVYGPTEYGDAWMWAPVDLTGNEDYLVVFNQVITVDGGVAAPAEYHLLAAIGPSVDLPPHRCRP